VNTIGFGYIYPLVRAQINRERLVPPFDFAKAVDPVVLPVANVSSPTIGGLSEDGKPGSRLLGSA